MLVLILGGLLAGTAALDDVTRSAIMPATLGPERLRARARARLRALSGHRDHRTRARRRDDRREHRRDRVSDRRGDVSRDALAGVRDRSAPAGADAAPPPVKRSIAEGLRFVRSNNALAGSFAIDLVAMTFGMPRALFAVLSLTVYDAGATGTGLLYAALSAGGALAVLTSGWIGHARRLGRIVIVAVVVWSAAIAVTGLVRSDRAGDRAARARRLCRRRQRVLPLSDQPDASRRTSYAAG